MVSVGYLVDTDWVIHYFKGKRPIVARLQELRRAGLAISVVTLAELYEGVYGEQNPERREEAIRDLLRWVTVLDVDEEICRLFGRERHRLRQTGNLIGDLDFLIGATALQHNLTLLSNNQNHFNRLSGLQIESLSPDG